MLEVDSLTSNHAWDLVPLHVGRRVVNIMWVYKATRDASVAVSLYKARFVAKGCTKREAHSNSHAMLMLTGATRVRRAGHGQVFFLH
jgi:hypothetical protein